MIYDVWNMRLETPLQFECCPRAANEATNLIAEASHTDALSPNWVSHPDLTSFLPVPGFYFGILLS